ncbi:MAG: hypothetical protein WCO26_20035 [Deltaproteobacteria bacterium]
MELNKNAFDAGGFLIPRNNLFQRQGNIVYEVKSFKPIEWKSLKDKVRRLVEEGKIYRVSVEENQYYGPQNKEDLIELGKRRNYLAGDLLTQDEIDSEAEKCGSKYLVVSWDELKEKPREWLFIRGFSAKESPRRCGRALYEIKRIVEKKWGGKLEIHEERKRLFNTTTFSVILPSVADFFADQYWARYPAILAEGIDFRRSGFPVFIKEINGLSSAEPWGRWSDAKLSKSVEIKFYRSLPASFTLILRAMPFGSNSGAPVKIQVGDHIETVIFSGGMEEKRIRVVTKNPVFKIRIFPPFPKSPSSIGVNSDTRKLGIGFERIWIEE